MNCKQCQETIVNSFAAGEVLPLRDTSAHRQACRACREFYEAQQTLFGSMDAGLQTIANPQVPPSLLPGFQVRVNQQSAARRVGIANWRFAAVLAMAVLVLGVLYLRRHSEIPAPVNELASVSSAKHIRPLFQAERPPESNQIAAPKPPAAHQTHKVPLSVSVEATPEVIVLAEEREAFAKFVADLPEETEIAIALTRPAPRADAVPLEVALLEIQNLEIKPLEPVQGESSAN